jgi:hypothetical protein
MSEHIEQTPRFFIDRNGGYQTERTGVDKLAHDAWVATNTWGLTRDDLIRLSYFHGDMEQGSDGSGPVNGSNDKPHDVVYVSASGGALTRAMVSDWFIKCDSFIYGFKSAQPEVAALRASRDELLEALKEIEAIEDREWKPMQVFRSDEQVARDEARHDLACEIAGIARAAIKNATEGKQ